MYLVTAAKSLRHDCLQITIKNYSNASRYLTMIIMISGVVLGGPGPGPRSARNRLGRSGSV